MKIRLPKKLKDRLRALSEDNKRSLNAEIVHRLDESVHEGILLEWGELPHVIETLDPMADTEEELIRDMLLYEEQLHKIATALRKIRKAKSSKR